MKYNEIKNVVSTIPMLKELIKARRLYTLEVSFNGEIALRNLKNVT